MTRTVYRFRLAAVCLGLVTLAFVQEPGRVAADTKLDLAANPAGFLGRALHMWDGSGFFGQVQNQAYGYLWPVGPFFALLREIGVVPWAAQRIWWAVVLLVGFLGFVRLSRHLGVRSPAARVLAGLGYVLSARLVTELTTVSAEAWPMAVAPWIVLPLVLGAQRGSPRRWAALSGLAFSATGAINAVASAAVLPLGALFLLTRARGPRRRRLAAWWVLSIALASVWWAVPLLLLGRYSPPFLDWIEAAAITTGQNDPTSVLRGTSHWVPYLVDAQGPVWPAGWQLVSSRSVVAGTAVVTLMAFAGLLSRRLPERAFLVMVLSAGLALTGMAHVSSEGVGGLAAVELRALLDGSLAPLRNLHKFQPLVTLPLMMGLAHVLERVWEVRPRTVRMGRVWVPVAAGSTAALLAVAAAPAVTGSLVGGRSYLEIPDYWQEAAAWLNAQEDGRALVVPAASFGVYFWGRTQDEPLQVLDTQSWAVRDAVPLSSAGNIRLLDEIGRHLEAGAASEGLGAALGRAGVRWLVIRNDLNFRATRATIPILLHQALGAPTGLSLAAVFGPTLSAFATGERIVDGGLLRPYPAVEVYRVPTDSRTEQGRVAVRDASSVVRFTGASEAMLDLSESGVLGSAAAFADGDPIPAGAQVREVLTDTFRRAEADFGSAQRQYSETMSDTDPFRSDRPIHDYLPIDPSGRQSEARLRGAVSVTASSSGSSPFALRGRSEAAQPWAALDGDPRTAWVSGDVEPGVGQWWQVDLESPIELQGLVVRVVRDARVGTPPETLLVSTDEGSEEVGLLPTAEAQPIRLAAPASTRSLRLELTGVLGGGAGQGFGLAEVVLPDAAVDRPVLTAPSGGDGGLLLAARSMGRESCAAADTAIVCDPSLAVPGEERSGIDRIVDLAQGGTYRVTTRLRPRPGSALDAYLAAPEGSLRVTASSQSASDPAVRAQAAADQLSRTTWIASPLDRAPTLTLDLPAEQRVTGLLLQTAPDAPASRPLEVMVTVNGTTITRYTDAEGRVDLPSVRTDRIVIEFGTVNPVRSLDTATGASRLLPVGVTELQVLGGADLRMGRSETSPVGIPCGFAPTVRVDDSTSVLTSASTTAGAVLEGSFGRGSSCSGNLVLAPGIHRIRVAPTAEWLVERVYLIPEDPPSAGPAPTRASIVRWGSVDRVVSLDQDPRPRLLETTENFNEGWEAHLGDQRLEAFRVDGWRQAFLVPAGMQGLVQLTYAPDSRYRWGLGLGLLAGAALILLAAVPGAGARWGALGPMRTRRWLVAVPVASATIVGGALGGVATLGVIAAGYVLRRARSDGAAVRLTRSIGILGLGTSLAAQVVLPWPERASSGSPLDVLFIVGPSLALGALAFVWLADPSGPTREPASPGTAS